MINNGSGMEKSGNKQAERRAWESTVPSVCIFWSHFQVQTAPGASVRLMWEVGEAPELLCDTEQAKNEINAAPVS